LIHFTSYLSFSFFSNTLANTALTDFDTATDARAIDIPQAKTSRNATVFAAENLKDENIQTRQTVLEEEKTKAKNEFNDEETFLVDHW